MGMDLRGAGGTERFSVTSWWKVLQLAQEYGWQPTGTQAPTFTLADGTVEAVEGWSGTYLSNSYQRVGDEDAANIAEALRRALGDIPDFDTDEKWVDLPPSNPFERMMAEKGFEMSGPNPSLTPIEFFSGEAKQRVKDFIVYCQAGGFHIG
jgi:hypothetical protein